MPADRPSIIRSHVRNLFTARGERGKKSASSAKKEPPKTPHPPTGERLIKVATELGIVGALQEIGNGFLRGVKHQILLPEQESGYISNVPRAILVWGDYELEHFANPGYAGYVLKPSPKRRFSSKPSHPIGWLAVEFDRKPGSWSGHDRNERSILVKPGLFDFETITYMADSGLTDDQRNQLYRKIALAFDYARSEGNALASGRDRTSGQVLLTTDKSLTTHMDVIRPKEIDKEHKSGH